MDAEHIHGKEMRRVWGHPARSEEERMEDEGEVARRLCHYL